MTRTQLPNLLVLRCDTATGFFKVGWDTDMPIGRFSHTEVICETTSSETITPDSPYYSDYTSACRKACVLNAAKLEAQQATSQAQGWIQVPLNIHHPDLEVNPDPFGIWLDLAMQTLHRLCNNKPYVWVAITEAGIVSVRPSEPPRPMEAVEFQVWRNQQLTKLAEFGGEIQKGKLIVQESGLWFCPSATP